MTPSLALYIHWPFCLNKCPYCDFNSHVKPAIDHQRWQRALLAELADSACHKPDAAVTSIFFGGGTPSLMAPETVSKLIEAVRQHWPATTDPEITLEANPTSVESARFKAFRQAGVNRLSLGIQSLNDDALKYLGRAHSAKDALKALEIANSIFTRTSFDLIYALPHQDINVWSRELGQAMPHAQEHVSLYQLSIEPGTAFFKDNHQPMDADNQADLYECTADITSARGYQAYEISNYCQPGGQSLHNMTYWQGGEYLGIGPGAHERRREDQNWHARHRIHNPDRWLSSVEKQGHGTAKDTPLDNHARGEEILMTALRLESGLPETILKTATGLGFADIINFDQISLLVSEGLLILKDDNLSTTPQGRLCLNAILARLLN